VITQKRPCNGHLKTGHAKSGPVANVLNNEKKQQILALGQLGWSLRRIQAATHVRRETISTYLKAAGLWPPGGWGRQTVSKPAIGVTTGFGVELRGSGSANPGRNPSASACKPFQEAIEPRSQRLLQRRQKQAQFRDSQKSLDSFDFTFNKKMNRSLVFDLATGAFIAKHEDALFLGPPGTGKSHLAQAIGHAAIQQGYRVLYRETHTLLDELAETRIDGTRKEHMDLLVSVLLLIIDDLGMRKLPMTSAEDLLEIVMRI
jgi:chromosomal replication initiation ATPase DnaA